MSTITKVSITPKHMPTGEPVSFNCSDLKVEQAITPNWSEETTYGKMDPVVTFSHNTRVMNVSMVILANTLQEAARLQRNVDLLIKYLYPVYKPGEGGVPVLAAPPFFKLGMLHDKLYNTFDGYIKTISIKPGHMEDVVPLASAGGMFYERKYTIDFSFTILHQFLPGWMDGAEPGLGHGGFTYRSAEAIAMHQLNATVQARNIELQASAAAEAFNNAEIGAAAGAGGEGVIGVDPALFENAVDLRASLEQFGVTGGDSVNMQDVMMGSQSNEESVANWVENWTSNDTITPEQAETPGPTQAQNSIPTNSQPSVETSADNGVPTS